MDLSVSLTRDDGSILINRITLSLRLGTGRDSQQGSVWFCCRLRVDCSSISNCPTRQTSGTNICRVKSGMKLGICSCKKWREITFFKLCFLRKEEQQNFTRNFMAFFMATSTRSFRRKFHGSTSARLAETTNRYLVVLALAVSTAG